MALFTYGVNELALPAFASGLSFIRLFQAII